MIDYSRAEGDRVSGVKIRCNACAEPEYEDLELEKTYRLIMPSYLAGGGDGFTMLRDNFQNVKTGQLEKVIYEKYITETSPINQTVEERITIVDNEELHLRRIKRHAAIYHRK